MRYRIEVKPDDIKKSAHMVVISRKGKCPGDNSEIIGVPMRGVSKEQAESCRQSLARAFEYGMSAMRNEMSVAYYGAEVELPDSETK